MKHFIHPYVALSPQSKSVALSKDMRTMSSQ
jgi:hypothetical protein